MKLELLFLMKGTIVNFRRSLHKTRGNHLVIKVDGVSKREKANSLVGKEVVWQAPGKQKKQLKGKISSAHGNSGAVRAIFKTGMPGQCLGEKVEIG